MLTVCPMLSLKVFTETEGPNTLQPTPRSLQNKRNPLPTILTYNCLSDQGSMEGNLSQLFQMKSTQQASRSFTSNSRPPEPIPKPVRIPFPPYAPCSPQPCLVHSLFFGNKLNTEKFLNTEQFHHSKGDNR